MPTERHEEIPATERTKQFFRGVGVLKRVEMVYDANETVNERRGNRADIERIAKYLEEGVLLVGCAGRDVDQFDPKKGYLDRPPHLLTDGGWCWYATLPYYLRMYEVGLPDEFLRYLEEREYQFPDKSAIDINSLQYQIP